MEERRTEEERKEEKQADRRTRVNFRPVLFCALGLITGISLYAGLRFGGFAPSDLIPAALLVFAALFPLGLRRTAAVLLSVVLFAGIGALALHLYTHRFVSVAEEGQYTLTGTVVSVSEGDTYTVVVLDGLFFGGEERSGKCAAICRGIELLPADIVSMEAKISPVGTESFSADPYVRNDYAKGIRYTAYVSDCDVVGRSKDPFLRLNSALRRSLDENMGRDEADLAYALLTGNSGSMDEGISEAVRRGGIAHIFAVSGLHIGILYTAAYACFFFLKKYRFLPALGLAVLYAGLCGFSVSSVRAVILCGILGFTRAFGKKYDFLEALSFAALVTLLFFPQQWFSAGMRLSYGACLGLALFSAPLRRLLMRIRFPRFLAGYTASSLSVQIFTLPVMLESFGYVPALALLANFFLLPAVPVLFLATLLCALFALVIPPAAPFFLYFPGSLFSVFLYVCSVADVALTVGGFALGAGSALFITGCVLLSGRVRLSLRGKCCAAGALAVLFTLVTVMQNVVFSGCRVETYSRNGESLALVRTPQASVLIIDGEIGISDCEDFLRRTYGGKLSAVVVLAEDGVSGANTAAFLPAEEVRLCAECETGFQTVPLAFGEEFTVGGLFFRYESPSKLLLLAEGCAVEFDFEGAEALGADLFVGEAGAHTERLNYFLKDAIIKEL